MSSPPPVCRTQRRRAAAGPVPITLALAVALASCGTGAVEVPAPNPPPAAARMCRALHDRLPGRLRGLERRETTPPSAFVTAWGSPAIALRCGVPRPPGLHPTSRLAVLDGVNWLPIPADRPVTFTAVGRQAYIEVTVPGRYAPPGDVLLELTAPIKAAVPATSDGSL